MYYFSFSGDAKALCKQAKSSLHLHCIQLIHFSSNCLLCRKNLSLPTNNRDAVGHTYTTSLHEHTH